MDNNKDFAYKIGYLAAGVLAILATLVLTVLVVAAIKLLNLDYWLIDIEKKHVHANLDNIYSFHLDSCGYLRI